MEDTIAIKVKESAYGQDKWFEYDLSYEEFAYIQPILEGCKNKKECPIIDPNNPDSISTFMNTFTLFGVNKKTVIYNLKEKPKDYTLEQVMDFYKKENIILVENDKTETKQSF